MDDSNPIDLLHLGKEDFKYIYEPAEDTFLMLDALQQDLPYIASSPKPLLMEIGPGSGLIVNYLAKLLGRACCMACDINPFAIKATIGTSSRSKVTLDAIWTSLLDGLMPRQQFDIILFNPPYVPSEAFSSFHQSKMVLSDEFAHSTNIIDAAWAGGMNGRFWIDLLLPRIADYLTRNGIFYLLVSETNNLSQLLEIARNNYGLESKEIIRRRNCLELLYVIRFQRIR